MRIRPVAGLAAVAVVIPLVISAGALVLSFVPVLRTGVQPTLLLMVAAAGVPGVFFFVFFFGAPAALLVGTLAYAVFARRLRREPPLARWVAVLAGAGLGAVLLPPAWLLETGGTFVLVQCVGPALLGAAAGGAGAFAFFVIGVRPSPPGALAA